MSTMLVLDVTYFTFFDLTENFVVIMLMLDFFWRKIKSIFGYFVACLPRTGLQHL